MGAIGVKNEMRYQRENGSASSTAEKLGCLYGRGCEALPAV